MASRLEYCCAARSRTEEEAMPELFTGATRAALDQMRASINRNSIRSDPTERRGNRQ